MMALLVNTTNIYICTWQLTIHDSTLALFFRMLFCCCWVSYRWIWNSRWTWSSPIEGCDDDDHHPICDLFVTCSSVVVVGVGSPGQDPPRGSWLINIRRSSRAIVFFFFFFLSPLVPASWSPLGSIYDSIAYYIYVYMLSWPWLLKLISYFIHPCTHSRKPRTRTHIHTCIYICILSPCFHSHHSLSSFLPFASSKVLVVVFFAPVI